MGQFEQLLLRPGDQHAASGKDHRALGALDQLRDPPKLGGIRLRRRRIRAPAYRSLRIVEGSDRGLQILGEVDEHRSGPSGARDVERLLDGRSDVLGALDEVRVLHDRHRRPDDVGFLKAVGPDRRGRHLARDRDHRHRVHVGGGEPRHEVQRAGSAGGEDDADRAPLAAGVAVGGVCASLLVAYQDVMELGVLRQVSVEPEVGTARVPEDGVDTLADERLERDLRAGEQACGLRGAL